MARYRGYGQLCPIAKAAEILAERWTPLIVRELLYGSRHFNELRRGIPLISPAMLSQRLRALEDAGIVERVSPARKATEYRLLAPGRALAPLIEQLALWGQRFAVQSLRREDLDAAYLMWALHRCLRVGALGRRDAVIRFELFDAPVAKRRWWLVVRDGEVDLCLKNPGFPVDVTVTANVSTLGSLWLGHLSPQAAVRSGAVSLEGAAPLVRTFPRWCPRSPLVHPTKP